MKCTVVLTPTATDFQEVIAVMSRPNGGSPIRPDIRRYVPGTCRQDHRRHKGGARASITRRMSLSPPQI